MSATRRILHVIPSVSRVHGGPSEAVRLMARAMDPGRFQVEIVATDDDGRGRRLDAAGVAAAQAEGIRVFPKNTDAYKVSLPLARWLRAHVADYDLLHIHALFSFSSTVAAWAAARAGIPFIIRPLGTLARYGLSARRPGPKKLSVRLVESRMLSQASAVHFTSEAEREEAAELGVPLRAVVVPLSVEDPTATPPLQLRADFPPLGERDWILFISRLDPKKNVEALLDAAAALAGEFPQLRWLVAGEGEPAHVASLHAKAESLGLGNVVVWTGRLDGGRKSAAFAGATMFVLPSHSENFGIAAAEALRAGLPVVLAEGVAIARLASDAGAGIAIEANADALASAVHALLVDDARRQAMAGRARMLGEREYSLSTMAGRLGEMYEALARKPGGVA